MKISELNCPSCGAPFDTPISGNKRECSYCGSVFELDSETDENPQPTESEQNEKIEIVEIDMLVPKATFKNWQVTTILIPGITISQGEERKVNFVIYNLAIDHNLTVDISLKIHTFDREEKLVDDDTIKNVVYTPKTRRKVIGKPLSGLPAGIYMLSIALKGYSEPFDKLFIVGDPPMLQGMSRADIKEAAGNIAARVVNMYMNEIDKTKGIFGPNSLDEDKIRKYLEIPNNVQIYAFADSSATGSGKKGLAICSDGIYCNKSKKGKRHMDWHDFLLCDFSNEILLSFGDFSISFPDDLENLFMDMLPVMQVRILHGVANALRSQ